jgi:nucleoid DNA-binding protein
MAKSQINPNAIYINTKGLISEVAEQTSIPREICKRVIEQFEEQIKINLVNGKHICLDKFVTIRIQKRFFAKNTPLFTNDGTNFFIRIYVKSSTHFSHFARLFMPKNIIPPLRIKPGTENLKKSKFYYTNRHVEKNNTDSAESESF